MPDIVSRFQSNSYESNKKVYLNPLFNIPENIFHYYYNRNTRDRLDEESVYKPRQITEAFFYNFQNMEVRYRREMLVY
jgi:hypothetical protein